MTRYIVLAHPMLQTDVNALPSDVRGVVVEKSTRSATGEAQLDAAGVHALGDALTLDLPKGSFGILNELPSVEAFAAELTPSGAKYLQSMGADLEIDQQMHAF